MDLVDQKEIAIFGQAELVLSVHQEKPSSRGFLLPADEQGQRSFTDTFP